MREVAAEAEKSSDASLIRKRLVSDASHSKKGLLSQQATLPLLHIDTQWKFQTMYDFRNHMAKTSGMDLIVYTNPEGVEKNINPIDHGSALHTDIA